MHRLCLHLSPVAIQAELILVSVVSSIQGYFYSHLDGMTVYCKVTPLAFHRTSLTVCLYWFKLLGRERQWPGLIWNQTSLLGVQCANCKEMQRRNLYRPELALVGLTRLLTWLSIIFFLQFSGGECKGYNSAIQLFLYWFNLRLILFFLADQFKWCWA